MDQLNPNQFPILGIHGLIGSGKDTLADFITGWYKTYTKHSFADPIRKACMLLFGFTEQQMHDRILKERDDAYWGFSPRQAMQRLGTDYGRDLMRKDIWLLHAKRVIQQNYANGMKTILSDVRFENEAQLVRDHGGIIIHLRLPPPVPLDPERVGIQWVQPKPHESEQGIEVRAGDLIILNDKSRGLEKFYEDLGEIIIH